MLEVEIQKLTAAVEALTAKIDTLKLPAAAPAPAPVPAPVPAVQPVHEPVKTPRASKKAAEAPAPLDPPPSTSKDNLKAIALEISRNDNDAKKEIFSILESYGAKTITALPDDPAVLHDVFTRLSNVANKIARDAE